MARCMVLQAIASAAVLLQAVNALNSALVAINEERDEQRKVCIRQLQDEYRRVIGPHVKGKHAQLVDMVWHGNLGDCFIEYGEQLFLKEMGTPLRHYCSMKQCSYEAIWEDLNSHPNESVIVVHGGGNFGDVYKDIATHHVELIHRFRDVPIIFLPQSVHYYFKKHAQRDIDAFAQHPNVLVLVRDISSLEFLRENFVGVPSQLCPDGAIMVGPVDSSNCQPKVDIFFLKRTDPESRRDAGDFNASVAKLTRNGVSFMVEDWPCGMKFKRDLSANLNKGRNGFETAKDCLCDGGRVIVTDRLHATIMATVLGLPYVYLDNNYKKITKFREAMFGSRPACSNENLRARGAATWEEAVEFGLDLLKQV